MIHAEGYRYRRFLNWFPMGLTYALLYMGRYNLTVSKNALGSLMTKEDFGWIFGIGAVVYAVSFLVNGPLVDRIGGKRGILIAAFGAGSANLAMGFYLWRVMGMDDPATAPLRLVFSLLYGLNMYFQSYGAVSIVKVNAHWFHVTERGTFSGIFGVMISSGIFLAFDVTQRILDSPLVAGQGYSGGNATWWAFLSPSALLFLFFFAEIFFLRDRPSQAGFTDFDTGDESSGEDLNTHIPTRQLLRRILTHPVILTVAGIEFCTGVLRNGVMHWFPILAKEKTAAGLGGGWDFMLHNWGLLLMIAGIIGGNLAGIISDKVFQSRRAPSAGFLYLFMLLLIVVMGFSLADGWLLGALVFGISVCVIGTHGLLSGTATMDFGGRRGAATAVGIIDGFVYLGTAVQSFALGWITTRNWAAWPWFLLPFAVIGLLLLLRIWTAMPGGIKKVEELKS
ncbi:MAG: MFS transporter [Acidobacteriota bacterium]|jgi:OPA family glycerol-3-phosphate transporter-like MFS transporter|nr:MFS transporter [Acidobacteriota bacterium]